VIEPIDLGVCRGYRWGEGADRVAVALPGAMFAAMPSIAFPIYALVDRGWSVVQVWDEFRDRSLDATAWVRERAEAALAAAGRPARVLLVAKSLSTRAAALAAERSLPAIWLTPLLDDAECVDGLRRRTAPALLVGGTADPSWDGALARELSDDVLELPDADHGFAGPHGVRSLLENFRRVADAVDPFAAALG
jgi:hypothetical protein